PRIFLFILTRPPPISTLFPYTTLFRSHSLRALPPRSSGNSRTGRPRSPTSTCSAEGCVRAIASGIPRTARPAWSRRPVHDSATRSEEHTSELQSRGHLVCRLLLEKKKD